MSVETIVGEIQFQARIKVYIEDGALYLEQESMHGEEPDVIHLAPANIERLIDTLTAAQVALSKAAD